MRRIRPLGASRLEPAPRFARGQEGVQEPLGGVMGEQTFPKIVQQREIEAGVIWINSFDEGDMTQPFGGFKQSGHARDKCFDSIKSYMQSKSAWFRLS